MVSQTHKRLLVKKQYLGFKVRDSGSRSRFAQLMNTIHRSLGQDLMPYSYRDELEKLYTENGDFNREDFKNYENGMLRLYKTKLTRALLSSLKWKKTLRAFANNIFRNKFFKAFRNPNISGKFFDCLKNQLWLWNTVNLDNLIYSEEQYRYKLYNLNKPPPAPKIFRKVVLQPWQDGLTRIFMSGADRSGRIKYVAKEIPHYVYNILDRPRVDNSPYEIQYTDNILSY